MAADSLNLDLPSIQKSTGFSMKPNKSPMLPKKITSVAHISQMKGFQNRMSGTRSRLGPPKRPHVTKRGATKAGV
jgi:hypothetical protein